MSSGKFHIENRIAEPRFTPKGRFSIARNLDECINCGKCAALCVYGVHGREELDYRKMAEPIDYLCRDCFMCTQGCPEQALTIGINPDFMARGDGLFKPEIVASLMEQSNRSRLTTLLQGHVAEIAADLRAQMRVPGAVQQRARSLHADEQVGEDYDVWTDLLSRRAAVLWVLKTVYVRVLEDKGLISPGRLLDPEAWQLFEKLLEVCVCT